MDTKHPYLLLKQAIILYFILPNDCCFYSDDGSTAIIIAKHGRKIRQIARHTAQNNLAIQLLKVHPALSRT